MNDDRIRLFDELNGSARSRGISEATRATRSGQIGEGKLGALPQEVVPEVHRRSAVALLFIVQQEVLQRTQTAQLGIHVYKCGGMLHLHSRHAHAMVPSCGPL